MDLMNYYYKDDIEKVKFEGEEYNIVEGAAETIEENMQRSYSSILNDIVKELKKEEKSGGDELNNDENLQLEDNEIIINFAGDDVASETASETIIQASPDDARSAIIEAKPGDDINLDFVGAEESEEEKINIIFDDNIDI
jgi:hypothetical protein